MTRQYVDPVVLPPDAEILARAYLLDALAPTPVATRLPRPEVDEDTVNGMLRVEYGGGSKPNWFQYDVQILLHAYNPNEIAAKTLAAKALALMGAARGQTVNGWYVAGVMGVTMPTRLTDPNVNLPRFLSTVTWRVAGQQWNP